MRYQLHTKDVENQDFDQLIKSELLPKLNDYMLEFSQHDPLITIHIKKDSRWGFDVSADLMLPEKYHIHAEVHQETVKQALRELRKKIRRQLVVYKQNLINYA